MYSDDGDDEQQGLLQRRSSAGAPWRWACGQQRALSALTAVLLVGFGLGIWLYGMLPTSDRQEHPYEYALETGRIRQHLAALLDIASQHNNSRSVATGHAASGDYVEQQLRRHGDCDIQRQHFMSPVWTVRGVPRLWVRGPVRIDYIFETDFQVMRYGGQGANITGAGLVVVDGDACVAGEIGDVQDRVAVVRAGGRCSAFEAAFALEQLGARAVVFARPLRFKTPSTARVRLTDWKEGDPLMTVPVLSVTGSVGQLLAGVARDARVGIETDTSIDVVKTFNLICVGRTGDPRSTVVVGAHLDSVAAGPGMNDNGSGSMSTLEIRLTLARMRHRPRNRLVFAWWGAEEDGLLGSRHFARVLAHGWANRWSDSERIDVRWRDIALDLNFDMLASPNFIALVHNGTDAPAPARRGSQTIQRLFESYFARHSYPHKLTDMVAGSDFVPFIDNGVPAGGVLTGAGELKSSDERRDYGGLARAALDTCYHRDCDTLLNINMAALHQMSRAAMHAVAFLSGKAGLRAYLEDGQP